jgi:flagella basal body P-ring formation protein FlgA
MIPLAAFALAGCLAVSSGADRIVAGDLAPAFPGFAAVAPDTELALAPAPGVTRVFSPPELQRLALRLRLAPAPQTAICVERPVAAPDPSRILTAMHKDIPDARIEILDYSRQPQPEGEIEFPLRGLQSGAGGAMWMGFVHYGSNRRFTIWARVNVLVTIERVLAAGDLRSGQAIAADQVATQTRDEFPALGAFAKSLDEVVGRWPRIAIRAGSAIRLDQLELPKEVVRGDTVQVEVRKGAVRMQVEAQAEASGALHETIPVLNTASKRRFLARVEGKGRVSVDDSAGKATP